MFHWPLGRVAKEIKLSEDIEIWLYGVSQVESGREHLMELDIRLMPWIKILQKSSCYLIYLLHKLSCKQGLLEMGVGELICCVSVSFDFASLLEGPPVSYLRYHSIFE